MAATPEKKTKNIQCHIITHSRSRNTQHHPNLVLSHLLSKLFVVFLCEIVKETRTRGGKKNNEDENGEMLLQGTFAF